MSIRGRPLFNQFARFSLDRPVNIPERYTFLSGNFLAFIVFRRNAYNLFVKALDLDFDLSIA